MFDIIGNLAKATVGLVIETPIALVKDVVTFGGLATEKSEPYTITALSKVVDNVSKATD